RRFTGPELREPDDFSDVSGSVLVIGFGRFGQIVSQCLLAEGIDVTTIDNDPEMMESAAGFGFKVYYGDGTRLDVLRAAGARGAGLGRCWWRWAWRRARRGAVSSTSFTPNFPAQDFMCALSIGDIPCNFSL